MRYTLFLFLLWMWSSAPGQFTLHLVSGDSIIATSYYIRLDSVSYPGGKVAMDEILYMRSARGYCVFKLPVGPVRSVRMHDWGTPCWLGKLQAERYEFTSRVDHQEMKARLAALDDPSYVECYKKAMFAKGTDLDRRDRPGLDAGIEPLAVTQDMVILRSGDTIVVNGFLSMLGSTLLLPGTKERIHKDRILVILTKAGQKIVNVDREVMVPLDPPVADLSPCSIGYIYAAMFGKEGMEWHAIPNIGATAEMKEALDCYNAERSRVYPPSQKNRNARR